jgi:alpha-1,4-digalacturonate transport system substrate-binding protein
MKKKGLIFLFLIAAFSMIVSATTVNLTMFVGDATAGRLLKNSVNAYEQSHPNIKIDVVALPYYSGFMKKIALSIAGGNLPDLIQITTAYIPQVSKYLIDIGPLIEKKFNMTVEEYRSQIIPSMDAFLGKKGEVLAVPLETTVACIWINKKMFEKAGITPPPLNGQTDTTWTWDQFISALKKVKEVNHLPYALSYDYSADRFYNFLSIWGVTVLDEKSNFVLDKYPQAGELFDTFISLFKNQIIPSAEWLSGASAQRDFFEGITAAYWSGSWQGSNILRQEKQVGGEYLPVYVPKGKDWFGIPGGSFLGAFKTGNKQKEEAAADFVTWMANKDKGYLTYIKPGLQLSAYKNQTIDYGIEKMNKWQKTYSVLLGRAPGWTMLDRANAIWSKLYDLIRKQIALGITGEVSGKGIVQNLKKSYEDIVSK